MSAEPSSLAAAAVPRSSAAGVAVRRVFTDGVAPPVRRHPMGAANRPHHRQRRLGRVRADRRRGPRLLVADGDQHRGAEVLSRPARHPRARELGAPADRPGGGDHGSLGHARAATSPTTTAAQAFECELAHLLVNQMASFNSPVWFNVGIEQRPQCSACFINSVQDSMESILDLAKTEGMLFKFGSGTGSNLSALRSSREPLAGGGTASGPVSFMRGFDSFAGVIKSGGKTRRAAKMVILNIDHPDIVQFIRCKAEEEKKAHVLIAAGYPAAFDQEGGAYDSIQYQNANHSVRVTDEFMRAVEDDGWWETRAVRGREVAGRYRARDLMRMIGRGHLGLRRSRHPVRHHHQPLAHLQELAAASTPRTPAPSTCSSTTRRATCRRST